MPKGRKGFVFRPTEKKFIKNKIVCGRCNYGYLTLTQNGLNLYYCEYCKQNYFFDEETLEYRLLKPYKPKYRTMIVKLKSCVKSKLKVLL